MRPGTTDGCVIRTDMNCHQCSKNFIAQLESELDGNHIVECPYCGHEHCRVIKDGKVTGDRWDTREQRVDGRAFRSTWKSDSQPIVTSVASAFLREAWMSRLDAQL